MKNCSYCSINDAYNNDLVINPHSYEEKQNKHDLFQNIPYISTEGTLIDNKQSKQPIIEHFNKCNHINTCPHCKSIIIKYKQNYKNMIIYFFISLIIIMLFDLFD